MFASNFFANAFREQFCIPAHLQGPARSAARRELILEAIGSVMGMGGAAWLALRIVGFSYAYIPFTVSSVLLTIHFYRKRRGWIMMQQAVFSVINLGGIYCWILAP